LGPIGDAIGPWQCGLAVVAVDLSPDAANATLSSAPRGVPQPGQKSGYHTSIALTSAADLAHLKRQNALIAH